MDLSNLLEQALAERGNVVVVIADPRAGEDAVIQAGNAPFANMVGWPADRIAGVRLAELRTLIERPEDWAALVAAVRSLAALTLDLRLRVKGREAWLGFSLTFKIDAATGEALGILIGRDITEVRERTQRESESQRLLASVFLRIGAAVAIIDGDSTVLMANPACQQLLGYGPGEMTGAHVEDMIAPDYLAAVHEARSRQLGGAGDYVLHMNLLARGGARVPVTLHSTLLRDARDRRLRVATLIPDAVTRDKSRAQPASAGQVREISLVALKAAYGNDWSRIAERQLLLVEQILRRHLGSADVYRRRNDDGYLIWFDGHNEAGNDIVLAAAVREIRQRLLATADGAVFGSVAIGNESVPGSALALDPDDDGLSPPARDAGALMRYLRGGATPEVETVTGRDGVERPIVLVDFEPAVRGRLYELGPSLPREPDLGTGFDLMRLDLAVQALAAQTAKTKVLVPISWPTVAEPECRQMFDRRLTGLGAHAASRLMLAVSGVPRLLSKERWSDAVGPLQYQLAEVGLLLTHRDSNLAALQDAITSEWPLWLLVVDRTEGPPVMIDEYRALFAAARRREISVVVRTTAKQDLRDWRALGATMFVTAG